MAVQRPFQPRGVKEGMDLRRFARNRFLDRRVMDQGNPPPSLQSCQGTLQLERLIDGFLMAFENFNFDVDELIDSGEHVAAVGTAHGEGGSGLKFALRFLHLWRFRDGKVVWVYDCAGESVRP